MPVLSENTKCYHFLPSDVTGFARALEEELRENPGAGASEEKKEEKKDDAKEQ